MIGCLQVSSSLVSRSCSHLLSLLFQTDSYSSNQAPPIALAPPLPPSASGREGSHSRGDDVDMDRERVRDVGRDGGREERGGGGDYRRDDRREERGGGNR